MDKKYAVHCGIDGCRNWTKVEADSKHHAMRKAERNQGWYYHASARIALCPEHKK